MNCHKKSNFFKFHLRKFDGLARCGTKRDSLLRRCRVFCVSKGTRQLVAPRQTYLREAVLLRNSCHCLILSLKTNFQTISATANNLQFGK